MPESIDEKNKALVLQAFAFCSTNGLCSRPAFLVAKYIQHKRHIPPGREDLFELVEKRSRDDAVRESTDSSE